MGGETKIFKRGQTESRDECLKGGREGGGGLEPPYELWVFLPENKMRQT